jgi:hypothetical protein
MGYITPDQYGAYGLDAETADELVTMASALMDGYCRRPTLLAAEYTERVRLIAGSQTFRLSYGPLSAGALVSGRVRYAKPRRGEDFGLGPHSGRDGMFIQEVAAAFGLPGSWATLDVTTLDVYAATREVTLPANFLSTGIGYNEVELTYTAGLLTVTPHVMAACAQIVKNAQAIPALNVKSSKLDTLEMQYFSGDLIDEGVARLLAPHRAERLG